jgi:hypothetical protein
MSRISRSLGNLHGRCRRGWRGQEYEKEENGDKNEKIKIQAKEGGYGWSSFLLE